MHHHRFQEQLASQEKAGTCMAVAPGFMVCPAALTQGWQGQSCPWQDVYRLAFEQAQAVARPSRLERLMKDLWN